MDNNLISIDNLIKHRLEGGEEPERSGSWLQMRDLLDKEMPRNKRIGFLYWRKWITYTGILLLLVAGSIGGYEMSSAFRPAGNNGKSLTLAANTIAPTSKTSNNKAGITGIDNNTNANQNSDFDKNSSATQNNKTISSNKSDKSIASNNTNHTASVNPNHRKLANDNNNKVTAANTESKSNHALALNSTPTNVVGQGQALHLQGNNNESNIDHVKKSANSVAKNNNNNGDAPAKSTFTSHDNVQNPLNGQWQATPPLKGNTSLTYLPAVNKSGSDANGNAVAKHHKKNKNNTNQAIATPPTNSQSQQSALANNEPTPADATTDNKTASGPHADAGLITSSATGADAVVSGTRNKRQHTNLAKNKVAAMKPIADNSGKADSKNGVAIAKTHMHNKKSASNPVSMNSLAIAGALHQPSTVAPVKDDNSNNGKHKTQLNKITATTPKSAHKSKSTDESTVLAAATHSKKQGVANPTTGTGNATAANTKHGNKHADKNEQSAKANIQPAAAAGVASVQQPVAKKVKTKILRLENRYIKMSPSYGFYRMDTVSIDEIELPEDLKNMLTTTTAAKQSRSMTQQKEDDSAERNAVAEIYPNAAAAILAKPYTEKQAANTDYVKGESGSAAESLSKLFNEIKYNVNGVHLQAGVVGGINATFFGPSGMKGFNFGFQCNAEFNNTWSVLAQLQYFHRINNSYVMNNNYSKYVQGANSMYQKDSISQTIGFATIHSFELPIAVQYSKENFIFSLGMNFAYTLPINIDEAPSQITTLNGTYAAAGKESAPVFNVNDFGARFGIGYLIGISYRVAPDVTINLRDVQTFWDNSGTQGAKTVSSQLYKSPSFQLSFGYTFGVKKDKK